MFERKVGHELLMSAIALVLVAGIALPAYAATSTDSPGAGADAISPPKPCVASDTVLLIQDVVPWGIGAGQDARGAFVNELILQNKLWCSIGSDQIGATDLSQFDEIIIASAQTQAFYDNLFPSGVIHPAINTWVLNGGILSASLAHFFAAGWEGDTFVGGVKEVFSPSQDDNIADASHPLVADTLPCPSGNCAPIVDVGAGNDLDNWNFADHGFFTNLPAGTTVILTRASDGKPVAIEYPHGSGRVIANVNTDAWRYAGFGPPGVPNLKYVANDIAYQDILAIPVGGLLISTDMTALFVAGIFANAFWMLPAIVGIAGTGIYFVKTRKQNLE